MVRWIVVTALAGCGESAGADCGDSALENARGGVCDRSDPGGAQCSNGLACSVVCLCNGCAITSPHGICNAVGGCDSAQLICDDDCAAGDGWSGDFCFAPQ